MLLREVIPRLATLDRSLLICAKRPWSETSDAVVVIPSEGLGVPAEVTAAGFEYFLDVPVAIEVLGVFQGVEISDRKKLQLLIHYAEYDAYPDWAYRV